MTERRPRLLVLASTYPRWAGDPEPGFVHALCQHLQSEFEIIVATPHAAGAAREERLDGIQIYRYRYAPAAMESLVHGGGIVANLRQQRWKLVLVPAFLAAQLCQAYRLSRRWQPDLIHAHWLFPQGLAAALTGRAYVLTSHGGDLYGLRGRLFQLLKQWAARRASAVAGVSAAMQAPLQALAGAVPVTVLPMGVDLSHRFSLQPAPARQGLLFVGRLVEKKGLDVLLRALPAILKQQPALQLTVVGEGPMRAPWQALAQHLGVAEHVQFVGARPSDQLPAYYRAASLFVAPFVQAASGDQEGLGLVLVEALGCGCPVVVSDLPACADVYQGLPGVTTVASGDVAALAAAVLADLPRSPELAAAVAAARPQLYARFDWSAVAARYAAWLRHSIQLSRTRA